MRWALDFPEEFYLFFFWDKRDYSSSLAYGKRTMLKSKVVTGQQIVADVRPKESVEFSGQTISSGGFVIVKIFERNYAFFLVYQSLTRFFLFFA